MQRNSRPRENSIEEKRKMRNECNKRKRQSRAEKEKEARDILRQKERDTYSRAKDLARLYYGKWKQLVEQNKRKALDRTKLIDRNTKSLPLCSKFSNVNLIAHSELHPINGNNTILGEGSFGPCVLKQYTRLNIKVVEKQSLVNNTKELMKEAQVMQALTHQNIPAILGVQVEKEPVSLIMEFKGEENLSVTISKLLCCTEEEHEVQKIKTTLTQKDGLIITHDLIDALSHIHYKGFLHFDLKSNNVLVCEKHGDVIDFGKACDSSFPPAKKYTVNYAHIAPEVLNGAPCNKASDVYSLGKILYQVALKENIPSLLANNEKCLDANPARRPTTTGLMASLASF